MRRLFTAVALTVLLPLPGSAATYQMLLERDTDTQGQTDLFLVTFPTLADLVDNTNVTQAASQIQLSSAFSVGGFAYDGFPPSEPPPPPIPLPASSLLLLGGIGALMAGRRRGSPIGAGAPGAQR